jgi:hypothetical protein
MLGRYEDGYDSDRLSTGRYRGELLSRAFLPFGFSGWLLCLNQGFAMPPFYRLRSL